MATYFAAEAVARRRVPGQRPPSDAPFSIFALRRSVFEACNGLDPNIVKVHVPSATNANLHAQGGLFTLIQPIAVEEFPVTDLATVLERLAPEIRIAQEGEFAKLFPLLIEFRVPAREARTTLMLLERFGVTAASVFPGLGGVARSLDEPRFYEWARPGSRS